MNHSAERSDSSLYLWSILFALLLLTLINFGSDLHCQSQTPDISTLESEFSLPGGYYDRDIQIELAAPCPDGEILFTLDGRVPTEMIGTVYRQPIILSAGMPGVTVVRARVFLPDLGLGPVTSASYVLGVEASLPILSLIVSPDDLWHPELGIYANPYEKGLEWERPVDVTFVDQERRSGFHLSAGLRVHGGWTRSYDKKSLRLYFRDEYGANRLEYPLFPRAQFESFKRLVLYSGGQDSPVPSNNWTLIRSALLAELAFQMEGEATNSRPVLLFLNGESWGIYQIRERIDQWFLADHYGIESADLLDTPQLEQYQVVVQGDREHWDHLLQYVETRSLADADHYAYLETQVDLSNFMDYAILQIYSANIDWPHRNVNQFRPREQGGRWRWVFWDSDFSFGLSPLSRVDQDMLRQALRSDHPNTDGVDTLLLRRLLENPIFFNRFLTRTADLLNTTLSPQTVTAQIDTLAAELEPNVDYETSRWFSVSSWQGSVQELRDFAHERPAYVRQHIVEGFDLVGTAELTFKPPAEENGHIAVNDQLLPPLPWQGVYFQGTIIEVAAVPEPGYRFVAWEPSALSASPVMTLTVDTALTIMPRFERLGGEFASPGDVVLMERGAITDSFGLVVVRRGGIDLRGWRVTDNDTKIASDEGSLIFPDHPAFAHVPEGTTIVVLMAQAASDELDWSQDDLDSSDRRMVLYLSNGILDTSTDPGFQPAGKDNMVLLAPGSTDEFSDDQGIDFVSNCTTVTPASFGVLTDGILKNR